MRGWQVLRACVTVFGNRRDVGVRLRTALETLGGAWAKVGQMLSTRYDLLPADVCDALRPLQSKQSGEPGLARRVVKQELGTVRAFAEIDYQPAAEATIGQVHRGRLKTGQRVAIKVIGPGRREQYAADLRLLGRIAWVVDLFTTRFQARELVAELRGIFAEELDLQFECRHARTLRPILKRHGLRVPRVYPGLNTASLLVSDWIDGVSMSDLLAMPAKARHAWLRARRLSGDKVASRLVRALEWMVFFHNRFHGDLHPGNIIVAGRRIYAIDCGATGETDLGFLERFGLFIKAVVERQYAKAADLYCLLVVWRPVRFPTKAWRGWWGTGPMRSANLQRQLVRVLSAWSTRTGLASLPFAAKSIGRVSIDLMLVIFAYGGAMSWAFLRITRAFSTMEATPDVLSPSLNYTKELRRFLGKVAEQTKAVIAPTDDMNRLHRIATRVEEFLILRGAEQRRSGILEAL